MEVSRELHILKTTSLQNVFQDLKISKYTLGDISLSPHQKMAERTYTTRVIAPEDSTNVILFLRRFFFRDEPLNIETGMDLDYISGKTCPELESYCVSSIPEGNSVLAESNAGEIVGVVLNGRVCRDDPEPDHQCPNDKFKKVLDLLAAADEQTDIFTRYPKLNTLLDVRILSVDTNWRGMGIATQLLDKTREVAAEQGLQVVRVDCTSHISALAVRRLGFEKIHALRYCDHLDKDTGKPVFNPPPPHEATQVYIYKLDDI